MRGQDREVDRAHDARALKTRRAVVVVIDEIRSEKQYRNCERRDLAGTMRGDISCSDEGISG